MVDLSSSLCKRLQLSQLPSCQVVGPLLSTILARPEVLVTQVMPSALKPLGVADFFGGFPLKNGEVSMKNGDTLW